MSSTRNINHLRLGKIIALLAIPLALAVLQIVGMYSAYTYDNFSGVFPCKAPNCTEQFLEAHNNFENLMHEILDDLFIISLVVVTFAVLYLLSRWKMI